jgi:hypothetical protein
MTSKTHIIAQVLAMLLQVLNMASGVVPPKYQPYVMFGIAVVQAGMGLYNHYYNPDGTPAAVAYVAKLLLLFVLLSGAAMAQTPAPTPTTTWSLTTSAMTLPGAGKTIMGVDSGISFSPTPKLDLFDRNLISNDGSFGYYAGGLTYHLPAISTALNNVSPNVNFLRLQFSPTASFGVVRLGSGIQHYGFTGGVRVDYSLTASGGWTLGAKTEYVQFPGVPSHAAVSLNAGFHF